MSLAARALLFAVRVYQAFFSVLMPSACKFYPSCSHYAAEALRIHGARRGSWLALRRVSRCHPFTRGGVDLVPDAEDLPGDTTSGKRFTPSTIFPHRSENGQTEQAAEKVLLLSSRAKRGIRFFAEFSKKQIPRANPALRNDKSPLFLQPVKSVLPKRPVRE